MQNTFKLTKTHIRSTDYEYCTVASMSCDSSTVQPGQPGTTERERDRASTPALANRSAISVPFAKWKQWLGMVSAHCISQ